MHIDAQQYRELFPSASLKYHEPLDLLMREYKINTPLRISHFLAQVGHECARFTQFEENLNYSARGLVATFGDKRFPGNKAKEYERQPEKIANYVYANRLGNGDESSGDGWKYRGRGIIQLTGRANYEEFEHYHPFGVVDAPEWVVENPHVTVLVGIHFWAKKGLNNHADLGNLEAITRRINGGLNGLADRKALFQKAYGIFKTQEIRTLERPESWDKLKSS